MFSQIKSALFAGGCFWCLEPAFDLIPGVLETTVGYCNGATSSPTYEEVCSGRSGHYEAINVKYDPSKVTYEQLLATFWKTIDPTQVDGQFADRGSQYLSAIFYFDESQRLAAEASKQQLAQSGKFSAPIATKILAAITFYAAEEDHQEYYRKNPEHYQNYAAGSGRKGFIQKVWRVEEDSD